MLSSMPVESVENNLFSKTGTSAKDTRLCLELRPVVHTGTSFIRETRVYMWSGLHKPIVQKSHPTKLLCYNLSSEEATSLLKSEDLNLPTTKNYYVYVVHLRGHDPRHRMFREKDQCNKSHYRLVLY